MAATAVATRLASACACSSETPGLRRAYAMLLPLPRFASDGDGPSGIHTSVSPRDIPRLTTGSWNAGGMTPLIV
jgi:hypothetical protein